MATSEPVVLHHGREDGDGGHDEVRPSVFNGLLGGVLEAILQQWLKQLPQNSCSTRCSCRLTTASLLRVSCWRVWKVPKIRRGQTLGPPNWIIAYENLMRGECRGCRGQK